MLKFLRGLIIAIGIVLIGAAIALMIVSTIQINYLVETISQSDLAFTWKPVYWFFLVGAGVAGLLGGFGVGLGVGMPKRSFKQRLEDHEAHTPKPLVSPVASNVPDSVFAPPSDI